MKQYRAINLRYITGFTLIELVMVILLLGILAAGVTSFIGLSTQTYLNVTERDEIISTARFALERLNREVRNAVPNSIRVRDYDTVSCLDFVPIKASTTYLDIPVAPEPASRLLSVIPFKDSQGNDYQCPATCRDSVVVYPLSDTDVFSDTRDNTGKVFGINSIHYDSSNQWTIELDHLAGDLFDADSPTQRLYIVKSPIAYCIVGDKLYRFENYTLDNVGYVFPPVPYALMADHIKQISASNIPFQYLPATLQRNAMLQINLTFERADEVIVFHHDIHIANVP